MASHRARRGFIRATAAAVLTGLAGCAFAARQDNRETVTPAPVPTDPPTPTIRTAPASPPPSARFSFDATVVHEGSFESPPKLRVMLRNEGPDPVVVFVGASLLWSVDGVYPEPFVLLPEAFSPSGVPTTSADGCWSYTSDRRPAIPAIALAGPVPPDEHLATTFAVYSDPANEPCYPPGEYAIRDDIRLGANRRAHQELAVTLTIDDDGAFSAEANPPEITV